MRNTEIGTQQQGVQELLTKLPVSDPEFSFLIAPKGQHVYKYGPGTDKLHVVGAGVGQGNSAFQSLNMEVEMQEGGGFKCREGPLVRIGDER